MGNLWLLWLFTLHTFVRSQTITLYNQADVASMVAKSPDVQGNLVIASSFAGDVNLDGLLTVRHGLYCENATALKSISSSTLNLIGLNMVLRNLSALQKISFPKLYQSYSIDWWDLPSLNTVDFKSNGSTSSGASFGPTKSNSKFEGVQFIHIGKSFMSNLDDFMPPDLRSLSIYQNFRLQTLNLSELFFVENITIIGNDNLRTLDLGNTTTADFVKIDGDFDNIRGLKNITIKKHFSLKTKTPHDCVQYARMGEADIHCVSPNSTFHRDHPELLVWDGIVHTDFLTFPDINPTAPTPPADPVKHTSPFGIPFYAVVAVLSALILGIILFTCTCLYRRRRAKQKLKRTSTYSTISGRVPPQNYIPKAELPVEVERSGTLFAATAKASTSQSRAGPSELTAHIIHVSEVEPRLYEDGVVEVTDEVVLSAEASEERMQAEERRKLEVLKEKLEKVRVERVRLSRMQELGELENLLQEEVRVKERGVGERDS